MLRVCLASQICRNLEEVIGRKHDMICKMGEDGPKQDSFFIIESGNVEVFVMKAVEAVAPKELSAKEKEAAEREAMRKANLQKMGLKDDVKVRTYVTCARHDVYHRTAPHRTAPHRTAPHRTAPHHTTPHR